MGAKLDAVGRGASIVGRVLVSLLWAAGGVIGVISGAPLVGVVAAAYLAYLWLFGGRWLIY